MSWICSPTRERNSIGKDRLRTVPIHLIGAKLDTRGAFTDSTSREPKARAERRGPAFRLGAALAALAVLHDRLARDAFRLVPCPTRTKAPKGTSLVTVPSMISPA